MGPFGPPRAALVPGYRSQKMPHRGEPAGLGVEVGHMMQAAPDQVWVKPVQKA